MGKIVFFSTPAFGHLNSELPVVKSLVEKGYKVEWYCTKKYEELILKSGAEFCEYVGGFDELYNLSDLTDNFYSLFCGLLELNNQYFREYENKIDDDTRLILYDSMCSFAKNIARKKKIKSVCLCTTMAYNTFVFLFTHICLVSVPLFFKHGLDAVKRILVENKFRKENGISKVCLLDLFVNQGDITIVFTPPELQPFVKTFPKSFIFAGTTIKERKRLENYEYDDYDIYISFGTIDTENKELLTEMINDRFLQSKKVIINVGSLDIISPVPNIMLVNHTNQLALLHKCKLFINHGGLNSVYESADAAVLQICIPQQEEQRLTAKVIERKGLGINMKKFSSKKVRYMYENKDKYKERLAEYSGIIKKYDGTATAVNAIEKLLEGNI